MRFKDSTLLLILLLLSCNLTAQKSQKLWSKEPAVKNNHAELLLYLADSVNNTGAAVIICPGGSYHHLGMEHEGVKTAKWFSKQGINAFVLRYRVSMFGHKHPAMIQDFQQAIRIVRENAQHYGVDTARVGAIGFSAGGHLVTMGGAFHEESFLKPLGIETEVSLRPNWVAAIYPVVSMQDSLAHKRSRKSLLRNSYTKEQKDRLSHEMETPADMPPIFVLVSEDYPVVYYSNGEMRQKTQ